MVTCCSSRDLQVNSASGAALDGDDFFMLNSKVSPRRGGVQMFELFRAFASVDACVAGGAAAVGHPCRSIRSPAVGCAEKSRS
jgi:hypothetical protein